MRNKIIKHKDFYKMELYSRSGNVCAHALFDIEDLGKVKEHRWYRSSDGYAHAHVNNCDTQIIMMHSFILGKKYIDHINYNKLDNRKINLRQVTHSQNKMNRPKPGNNKSGIKGVCFDNTRKKWLATLLIRGKVKIVKRFDSKIDAINYRKQLEKKYFKEFNYKI